MKKKKVITNRAAYQMVTHMQADRWPTSNQEDVYHQLNSGRNSKSRPGSRIMPRVMEFPLIESVKFEVIDKLLTAASLRLQRVKRYPGWYIQTVYNLKDRPIQII